MLLELILWIIIISSTTLLGAWYAGKYKKADLLIGLYVSFVILSNIVAVKIVNFDIGLVKFSATAATLIFSVTFLMTDIVNEKFGKKETYKMIIIAFIAQIVAILFIWISISLPAADFWKEQETFSKILGLTPRIALAGWIAFIISENLDALIFSWFKKKTKGNHLWMRNAFSSIPAMALDTLVFVTIAFFGLQPLLPLIIGVLAVKWIVGIIDIPFMYLSRLIMYR